jgi:NAD+ synthase
MDLCLYAKDHHIPASNLVSALALEEELIERVYEMIDAKRKVARYLHQTSLIID